MTNIYNVVFSNSFRQYVERLTPENSKIVLDKAQSMIQIFYISETLVERCEIPDAVLIVEKISNTLEIFIKDEITISDMLEQLRNARKQIENVFDMRIGLHSDIYEILVSNVDAKLMESIDTGLFEIICKINEIYEHAENVRRERNRNFIIFEG